VTKTKFAVTGLILTLAVMAALPTAQAAPCLVVTLTGTQGGPQIFNGLAGAGTLVSYGEDGNNFGAVKMQFDAGRGTNMRLSQIGMAPEQLNAIFFTLPPNFYYRQSSAFDLGAMAKRAGAKHLMLTHLIPAVGAERHGPLKFRTAL